MSPDSSRLETALRAARDTRFLRVGAGVRHETAAIFAAQFPGETAVLIDDGRTHDAAGRDVFASFDAPGMPHARRISLPNNLHATIENAETLRSALAHYPSVPVVVGSGTLNDLTKLAAHRLGRPYLVVATAASMDGYTAYGASITAQGSKQTFDCPAPRAVLADLEVIGRAPEGMNASGYADLLAKNVAGADWILADAVGVEPILPGVWDTVQGDLRTWVDQPEGVAQGDPEALGGLVEGLMMSGFAMQAAQTSRPASGADHQFSHLWDMQNHTHDGVAPSHGFKVGIGTLASLALYQSLLDQPIETTDVDAAVAAWPTWDEVEARIHQVFEPGDLLTKAVEETRAKHPDREALRAELEQVRAVWPATRDRLRTHLLPFGEVRDRLRRAGCPTTPEAIGIDRDRLRLSYEQAYYIRRRYTVLDFARRLGRFDLLPLFAPGGPWGTPA